MMRERTGIRTMMENGTTPACFQLMSQKSNINSTLTHQCTETPSEFSSIRNITKDLVQPEDSIFGLSRPQNSNHLISNQSQRRLLWSLVPLFQLTISGTTNGPMLDWTLPQDGGMARVKTTQINGL